MKRWTVLLLLLGWFSISLVGCITETDPNTGETTTRVDPNDRTLVLVEGGAEAAGRIAPLFGPIGVGVGSLITGVLGCWLKIKPSLTRAKSKSEQYHAAAAASVTAITEFRKLAPNEWEKMKALLANQMTKQGLDPKIVENVIRGLRGLPARD